MPRVLLTSFEPFAGQAVNASLEIGRAVAARPPAGVVLDWLVLPVVAGLCVERAWERIEAVGPDLVLGLGQADTRAGLHVELRAVNRNDFPIPDNAGQQPRGEPVCAGGPPEYAATFPAGRVAEALADGRVLAVLSASAGEYVCNHFYYGLLHRAALSGRTHQTGFIHVPLLPSQRGEGEPSGRTLDDLAAAIRRAIAACLDPPAAERERLPWS